ncbi:hypothetical protein B0I35DRAFT_427179 [Stachybotrys elegans]|uniref:Oxysterol-binding protein n=1 Tax=Stachybotrys elegans TaxID=80388 RepID=A0A8K0SUI3_9HYPO|nr:hypothetical protein B0I35DRAFT_427179 [Stachybotrys elegans]
MVSSWLDFQPSRFAATMTHLTSNMAQLKDFLSTLASVKGDVSEVTAPPFVLAPKSSIEIPAAWAACHDLFLQPARESDPAKRALLVAKNYICSLKRVVGEGTQDAAKKPLNPFLGEMFIAEIQGEEGPTKMIAEQVSHHPPVTACTLYNRALGISSVGYVGQATTFSPINGVRVQQPGFAIITDERHNEKHLMTMPTILVKGITVGQPYPELEGPCYISSSTGYVTRIEFNGKTKFGLGSKNRFHAEMFHESDPNKTLFEAKGQWTGDVKVEDCKGEMIDQFNVDHIQTKNISVRPVEEQTPFESRKAWSKVVEGIKEGDINKVSTHKHALEESQRELRRAEERNGRKWQSMFFTQLQSHDDALKLLAKIPDENWKKFDLKMTAGAWKFVGGNAAEDLIKRLRGA